LCRRITGSRRFRRRGKTSPSAKVSYDDTPKDFLPMGFLALDLAKALDLSAVRSPMTRTRPSPAMPSKAGNGVLGKDSRQARPRGGDQWRIGPWSNLPNKDKKLADRTIKALLEQDYVSGLFVDDALGKFPGTLPMSQVNLKARPRRRRPPSWSISAPIVAGCESRPTARSRSPTPCCGRARACMAASAAATTMNFMAAIGPDFKAGYVDALPVSNADVGMTVAKLMGLHAKAAGELVGRVMTEGLAQRIPRQRPPMEGSPPSRPRTALRTIVKYQRVLSQRYFDARGFEGRTVGLDADGSKQKTAGK